jgi:hypothetical protein
MSLFEFCHSYNSHYYFPLPQGGVIILGTINRGEKMESFWDDETLMFMLASALAGPCGWVGVKLLDWWDR